MVIFSGNAVVVTNPRAVDKAARASLERVLPGLPRRPSRRRRQGFSAYDERRRRRRTFGPCAVGR